MTKTYNKFLKQSLAVLTIASLLTACVNKDEFFELEDRMGMDAAIWSTEGAVEMHLRETYDMAAPRFPWQDNYDRYYMHLVSDEAYISGTDGNAKKALGLQGELLNNDVRFVGNKYQGNNFGDNRYFDLARTNNAIKYIAEGTMDEAIKKRFLGQYHALRALIYFELVKVYGGVPLVLEPQTPSTLTVGARASAKECFDQILSDLDAAANNLEGIIWQDGLDRGRISPLIVACLKAKVKLYWASPQFNPSKDATRWTEALKANKDAYDMCVAAGKKLMPDYAEIFHKEGDANTEAIFVRTYSSTHERRGHNTERRVRPNSEGGESNPAFIPTTHLLNAYPMKDGNPIGQGAYTYDPIMFWQNRDPRFDATIAYNGGDWPLSGKPNRKQWAYVKAAGENSTGYGVYSKKFSTPNLAQGSVPYSNNLGGNGMDWIDLRFAEVMLNYAECANETGDLTTAKNMVREIRKRAGIEQGAVVNDYGLAAVNNNPDLMRDLITRERMVEFAFENKRNSDLRRLRKWHLLSGTIETVRIEFQQPSNNNRNEKWLEGIDANTGLARRDTLDINKKSTYLYYFKPALMRPSGIGSFSIPEYHYFYTFHNDFINSSPLIQPTIGWAGGTFDPLQDN